MDRSISQTVRRWIYPSISFHIILGLAQLFFSFCEVARVVTDIGKIYSGRMRGRTRTFQGPGKDPDPFSRQNG